MQSLIRTYFPVLWLAGFLYVALVGNSLFPPPHWCIFLLAGAGLAFHVVFNPELVRGIWQQNKGLITSFVVVAVALLVSESSVQMYARAPAHGFPPQTAVLLCAPALALFLVDRTRMGWVVFALLAVSCWNIVGMPIEAVNGAKLTWHAIFRVDREAGPFKYQASGLSIAVFYFTGVMSAAFYLAWGAIFHARVGHDLQISRRLMFAFALVWLIAPLATQSRAGFVSALAASLLLLMSGRKFRLWHLGVAVAVVLVAVAAFWNIFFENKTGVDLRLAYMKLYLERSIDPQWLLWGHGAWVDRNLGIPGLKYLEHSHNDLIQVFYAWGLVALVAYVALWVFLIRLCLRHFAARREYWMLAAIVSVFPATVTDLGLQHYEKAMFLVLAGAMAMAFAYTDRESDALAAPPADHPADTPGPAAAG